LIKFDQDKVNVIPLAADNIFKPFKKEKLKIIINKYNLPKKFIFYVGDLNWNKNIPGLVQAFAKLNNDDYSLVVAGRAFLNEKLAERINLIKLIKRLNIDSKVKFLGFIPTGDLAAIYNLATVYCQPSFYEGFGLPVLEAMACGCPVVSSNTSSLSEIAGRAAWLVKPEVKDINQGLKKVISDISIQGTLKEKGLNQIKKFSWEKTATETLKVYKKGLNDTN
jgi:glycosyltransferase involved in cell wall biosynthesis